MRSTTRRVLVGTATGLALAMTVPLMPADAHTRTSGPETGRHGWHSPQNPAESSARKALRVALKQAGATLHAAVESARKTYRHDPVVIAARAQRDAVIRSATDPTLILAAWAAYDGAVSGPAAARDLAIDNARTVYEAAVDAAYTAYDTATTTAAEATARAAFRTAVRSATKTYRAAITTANTTFKSETATARATLRAAVNAALATYLASGKTDGDKATFKAAIATARTAFAADTAVSAAKAERKTTVTAARTAYHDALKAARLAFFNATGHKPWSHAIHIPRV
jgi:hypothetical protein